MSVKDYPPIVLNVKIDVDKILSRSAVSTRFENFITTNRDTKFTAILDSDYHTIMYYLKEDTTKPRWLFERYDLIFPKGGK